jgi:ammonia channel protein AmtB
MGIAVLAGIVLIYGLDMVMGLRVPDEEEVEGLDEVSWHVSTGGATASPASGAPIGTAPARPEA